MDPIPQEGIDLSIFAPVYWGFVISLFLGGITIVQAYIYFPHPTDRWTLQTVAGLMLLLDLTSSGLVAQSIYYYLIPHFGSLAPLGAVTPELSAECLLSAIITFISQAYFAYQLYVVRKLGKGSWVVIASIAIFAVLAFGGGVACVTSMYMFDRGVLANRSRPFTIAAGLAKAFGAITDIIATIAMSMYLTSAKTGMNDTNSMLKSLISWVIQRGALVTLIQTMLLVTFYAIPSSLAWYAFHINVTKLYANTFFAMLNARDYLNNKHTPGPASTSASWNTGSRVYEKRLTAHDQHYNLQDLDPQVTANRPMPTVTKTVMIAADF